MRAVEMGLLDAAEVDLLRFEELLKFKFPMHDEKCSMTGSSTLSSPGHQKRIRAAVSRTGLGSFEADDPAPSHPGRGPPGRHHNDLKLSARPCNR